jgi:hypothetical protein
VADVELRQLRYLVTLAEELASMVVGYLALIEFGIRIFYGGASAAPSTRPRDSRHRRLRRRAAYFSTATRQPSTRR